MNVPFYDYSFRQSIRKYKFLETIHLEFVHFETTVLKYSKQSITRNRFRISNDWNCLT